MSLAMYAAPFDDDDREENTIAKKRTSNNRTQKRVPKENQYSEKVNSVLQSIHSYNEETDQLSDFKPLSPPVSAGVEQTKMRENMSNMVKQQENEEEKQQANNVFRTKEGFYQRHVPNYKSPYNLPYYQNAQDQQYETMTTSQDISGNDILVDKLNYLIKMMEEQQDERTNNVIEEVVLYCFLGIFIIFIVDSFVRVGKYVR
jgi:hypothetical protein